MMVAVVCRFRKMANSETWEEGIAIGKAKDGMSSGSDYNVSVIIDADGKPVAAADLYTYKLDPAYGCFVFMPGTAN